MSSEHCLDKFIVVCSHQSVFDSIGCVHFDVDRCVCVFSFIGVS